MFDPVAHLAHRQHITSPTLTRAHAGNEAAERLAPSKASYEDYRPYWQDLEREYAQAGANYRAALEPEVFLARDIMKGLFRTHRAAVAAEHISIDLERNAA